MWVITQGGSGSSCSCSAHCLILKYSHVPSSWCISLARTKLIKAAYLNINKINGAIKQKKLYSTKSSLFALLKKTIHYSRDKGKAAQDKLWIKWVSFVLSISKEGSIHTNGCCKKTNPAINLWCLKPTVEYGVRFSSNAEQKSNLERKTGKFLSAWKMGMFCFLG